MTAKTMNWQENCRIYMNHVMRKPVLAICEQQPDLHLCCSLLTILAKSKISRLYLVSVAEQTSLSLTWSETPKTGFLVTRLIYE